MIESNLFTKSLHLMDIDFLINSVIIEYDLSKANINILLYYKAISEDLYCELYNADRMTRQITIGNMMKDPNISQIISNGFVEARRLFFDANSIQDQDVLGIKKDAIYLLRKANFTKFDNLEFKEKNFYTSFYNIRSQRKEMYYCKDPITGEEKLDIKGINDDSLIYHKDYFMEFLLVLFETAQVDICAAIDILNTFTGKYLSRQLDLGYYRNFDSESAYTLHSNMSSIFGYKAMNLVTQDLGVLDINYNATILRELFKIYSKQYFSTNRKPRC